MEEENEVGESDGSEEHGDGIGDSVRSTTRRCGLGMDKTFVAAVSVALERNSGIKGLWGTRKTSKETRLGECACACSWLREHAERCVRGEDGDIICIAK